MERIDIVWKKPVFPLSVEKPKVPVTVEVIKQRNPFGVMDTQHFKHRQRVKLAEYSTFLKLFPAGSKKRLLFNKANRIKKAYTLRTALRDGKCIFCHSNIVYYEVSHPEFARKDIVDIHGEPIVYTSRAFACEKCDDKIWNSVCLNCGADISNLWEPFLFCEKCTDAIDEVQMKSAYKDFCERNADEIQARRKKWKEDIEESMARYQHLIRDHEKLKSSFKRKR